MNVHGADKNEFEALSALVDGELDANQAHRLLGRCATQSELFERWSAYQMVGDALRSAELVSGHRDDFVDRMRLMLEAEPPVLCRPARRASAWGPWAPMLATAAAVAMLVWTLDPMQHRANAERGARAIAAAAVAEEGSSLEAYVLAHLDLAGGTAFESPGEAAREVISDGGEP